MKKEERQKAVALQYERGKDNAPKVTAKGQGKLADKILALAREHNIPIHKDKALVNTLYHLDINTEIPEALYQTMAEILAFIYRMNRLRATDS